MQSIFDLKTNVDELSSANQGTSRMEYAQHPPTRDVTGSNFANGAIRYRFQTSGQKWWIPSRSYLRTRFQLQVWDTALGGGAYRPPTSADNLAPNMGLMSNLYQSGEMRINDKTVSRVADFMPQVDALETRLTKSSSWLESIGEATNWWDTKQTTRQAEVSSDGSFIEQQIPVIADGAITSRGAAGFYGAVGALAASNFAAYDTATGIVTFSQGGGAALPSAVDVWSIGDQFSYSDTGLDGVNNVRMTVVEVINVSSIRVEALIGASITGAADPVNNFYKVSGSTIGSTTTNSRRVGQFETTWQPPLSLFKVGHALPSGRYELVLNPQTATSFQRRAIESRIGLASKQPIVPGANPTNGQYRVQVVDQYFYCATVEGPRADDITYLLDLEQTRCQAEKIDNTNFGQKNFDVSPSTYALTVAYQDLRAGENTAISASKFKSYNNAAGGLIPTDVSEELKLNRLFINYAGQNLPAPDADPSFIPQTGADLGQGVDYTTQRYAESQIYSGAYFDTGGAETIQQYHERGSYYYFSWPRDGTDRSTRVNVHQQFNAADVANMRLLCFDHSKQVARVKVQDGRVVDVQVEDA